MVLAALSSARPPPEWPARTSEAGDGTCATSRFAAPFAMATRIAVCISSVSAVALKNDAKPPCEFGPPQGTTSSSFSVRSADRMSQTPLSECR